MKLLAELLDRPLKWKYEGSNDNTDMYSFDVEGLGEYEVYFEYVSEDDEEEDYWELGFSAPIEDDDEAFGIIGTKGKQIQIFSTVKDIINNFLQRRKGIVDYLIIPANAKEPSRVRLYKRFAGMLGNYRIQKFKRGDTDYIDYVVRIKEQ